MDNLKIVLSHLGKEPEMKVRHAGNAHHHLLGGSQLLLRQA